jgi:hypothetical protein
MDENALIALKELVESDEFRKAFERTAAKGYADRGGEETMLVVAFGNHWAAIPFSRLSAEELTPLLTRPMR